MNNIEIFVDENDYPHLISVEQAKYIKGDFVPKIWRELKEHLLNKWNVINGDNYSIVRAEHEFKFLLGLYDYFKDGYISQEILFFTNGMNIRNFTLDDYITLLNIPNRILERNVYNRIRNNVEEYLKN